MKKKGFYNNLNLKKSIAKNKDLAVKRLPFTNLILISFAISIAAIVAILILKDNIPPEVPLFYGLPDGKEQLGTRALLILPIATSQIFLLINSLLAYYISDEFLKKTLIISALAATFLSIITTVKILLLVGSF